MLATRLDSRLCKRALKLKGENPRVRSLLVAPSRAPTVMEVRQRATRTGSRFGSRKVRVKGLLLTSEKFYRGHGYVREDWCQSLGVWLQSRDSGVRGLSVVESQLWSQGSERCGVATPESWVRALWSHG